MVHPFNQNESFALHQKLTLYLRVSKECFNKNWEESFRIKKMQNAYYF